MRYKVLENKMNTINSVIYNEPYTTQLNFCMLSFSLHRKPVKR